MTTAEKVKLESVDEFIDELRTERRRLPIVVISPLPWTGESILDSGQLAQAVAFRAHVRLLDDAKVAWA
ncbi:MAG TPA: hypothetical protein VHM94_09425, partial [Acidimicrobiia bacterium]|nr:hypothetical protein [Acidimicrobiia bacterium]